MIDRLGDFDRWEASAWDLAEATDGIRAAWVHAVMWFLIALLVIVGYLAGWLSRLVFFLACC